MSTQIQCARLVLTFLLTHQVRWGVLLRVLSIEQLKFGSQFNEETRRQVADIILDLSLVPGAESNMERKHLINKVSLNEISF